MLESTFIFLPGVGESTEQRFWQSGITTWEKFLDRPSIDGLSPSRKAYYDQQVITARSHLATGQAHYFGSILKARDHWRLFQTFRESTAFLDIETTGGPADQGDITVVGIYGHGHMTTLVQGETLTEERLKTTLAQYDLLVTFFGSGFDLPYIRTKFPTVTLKQPHFDLCFAARRLGYTGGLKQIEHQLGLERPAHLEGLNGWDAVQLWDAWVGGDREARQRLLDYNQADTQNLVPLADLLFDQLLDHYWPERAPRP